MARWIVPARCTFCRISDRPIAIGHESVLQRTKPLARVAQARYRVWPTDLRTERVRDPAAGAHAAFVTISVSVSKLSQRLSSAWNYATGDLAAALRSNPPARYCRSSAASTVLTACNGSAARPTTRPPRQASQSAPSGGTGLSSTTRPPLSHARAAGRRRQAGAWMRMTRAIGSPASSHPIHSRVRAQSPGPSSARPRDQ